MPPRPVHQRETLRIAGDVARLAVVADTHSAPHPAVAGHLAALGPDAILHGGDVAYRPNGGRYCLDGLVAPDRTPWPGLAELKSVVAPVALHVDAATWTVTVTNKHDVRDLDHLRFGWVVEDDGAAIVGGDLDGRVSDGVADGLGLDLGGLGCDGLGHWDTCLIS